MNNNFNLIISVLVIGLLTACGSTNPPSQQLTETRMVIQQAEQQGAEDYAPLEIREAKKKLDLANKAVEDEEYDKAILLAEQARVDAELAEIKAQSGKAKKAVAELRDSIQALKDEIERNRNNN